VSLPEPGWITGDDFARGLIDECPKCTGLSLIHGECEECGYNTESEYDLADQQYDAYKESLVY